MQLFRGIPHPCNYLPDQTANSIFLDPEVPLNSELYAQLLARGFRRSGNFAYRPACPHCTACVPIRVNAQAFTPSRSQRRAWKSNLDLDVTVRRAHYTDEYFALYRNYLETRHAGGGMEAQTPDDFRNFLLCPGIDTRFHEFRLDGRLVAVAVVDHLPWALSAVYTFYDPALAARSLGTQAVLHQIHTARATGLPWVYLGFWIAESRKMAYKTQFQPAQHYRHDLWRYPDDENDTMSGANN